MRRGLLRTFGFDLGASRMRRLLAGFAAAAAFLAVGAIASAAPSGVLLDAKSGRTAVAHALHALDATAAGDASDRAAGARAANAAAAGDLTISAPPDMIVSEGPGDHTINLVVKLSAPSNDDVRFSAATDTGTATAGACSPTGNRGLRQFLTAAVHDSGRNDPGSDDPGHPRDDQGLHVRRGPRVVQAQSSSPASATIARSSTLVSIVNNATWWEAETVRA